MNKTEYIGKLNALYVGEKNCLEELITIYDEKDKEIERLTNIIDELGKDIALELCKTRANDEYNKGLFNAFRYVKDKLQELKGSE